MSLWDSFKSKLGFGISGKKDSPPVKGKISADIKKEERKTIKKHPGPWQIGDLIRPDRGDAYEVREIKGGGMGQVYMCIRKEDRTPLVLKTLQERWQASKKAVDRFKWESEVWVRLGKQRNIVHAHGTDTALGYTFVIIEYVAGDENYGTDLSGWIKKNGLSIPLALDFACQFCNGMLHAKETFGKDPSLKPPFIHRDIKPANILVTKEKVVKITDFGLVKAFDLIEEDIDIEIKDSFGERRYSFTKKGGVCGTCPYIAPEIWRREEPDERSDIYSFGCTLYEMFNGSPPFVYSPYDPICDKKYENAHLNLTPEPVRDISDEINELILKCLKKKGDERYQDFNILRNDLSELYYRQTGKRLVFKEETEAEWEEEDWFEKGNGLSNLGFNKEAIECYDRAIRLNPKNAFAYNNRGNVYSDLGQNERAIEDYNEAIRLNPKDVNAYYNRGNAYSDLGQNERAIEDYDEAIRLNPKDDAAYNNRGNAYSDLGQNERAIKDYEKSIELAPPHYAQYVEQAKQRINELKEKLKRR